MKTYDVTLVMQKIFTTNVQATSEEEALDKAVEKFYNDKERFDIMWSEVNSYDDEEEEDVT